MIDAWAGAESQGCDDSETPYPTSMDGKSGLACAQRANCATGAEVISCSWEGTLIRPRKSAARSGQGPLGVLQQEQQAEVALLKRWGM